MSKLLIPRVHRTRSIARIIGACLGLLGGVMYGEFVLTNAPQFFSPDPVQRRATVVLIAAGGAAFLALAAPRVSIDAFLWIIRFVETVPPGQIVGAGLGLSLALVIAALVAVLLGALPFGIGFIISVSLAIVLTPVGVHLGLRRGNVLNLFLEPRQSEFSSETGFGDKPKPQDGAPIVIDTSVLIDGRIVDVVKTGFIQGRLIIPSFVLEELQRVADSADPVRRSRGRHGLDVVDALKRGDEVVCEILPIDFPETPDVDARLVKLARLRNAALMTQDYNLNRLTQIEGVRVLNLNELANTLKPLAARGEVIEIAIDKEGREPNQGVGYLGDGTMVVVEGGHNRIGKTVTATVSSVLQTAAGRMIFAEITGETRSHSGPTRAPQAGDR